MAMAHASRDFPGGVYPAAHKCRSLAAPIVALPLPDELVLALAQHDGVDATVLVEPGQAVLKGEPIARAEAWNSAPLHAPTSGTVTAIELRPVPHPSGLNARCIVIAPDGDDRWIEHAPIADWRRRERATLLAAIHDAGITGLGGAGFPTAAKLATDGDIPLETLVINGAECEPYITADEALMRERADAVIAGVRILAHLLGPTNVLIGIEADKRDAGEALGYAIAAITPAADEPTPEVVAVPAKYPSGGEKQLIYTLTGREVPSGGLPPDIGALCVNVASAYAVQRAIEHGEPLVSRVVTVTGEALGAPGNVEVPLGTPFAHLLSEREVDRDALSRLVMGGPMMGFTLATEAPGVVKTTNCVLATTREAMPPAPPAQPCIRCGHCAEVCPQQLLPQQLYWYSRARDFDAVERFDLADCIECGACAYVCPSHIPLVQYYRYAKGELDRLAREQAAAERARARFEHRQQRLEATRQASDERRRARRRAATDSERGGAKADVAQRAAERVRARKAAAGPGAATTDVRSEQLAAAEGSVPRRDDR